MKKIYNLLFITVIALSFVGCMKQLQPQDSTVSEKQVFNAPNTYENLTSAITSNLCGNFTYAGSDYRGYDFGYPAFMLIRDIMGQDIFENNPNWFSSWYNGKFLGPNTAVNQLPWTYYFKWIKNCNILLAMTGENPDKSKMVGAGIAHAMRAMFYMDLARLYCNKTYKDDLEAKTVSIITEKTTIKEGISNPRASNKDMWAFILSDLDKAEKELKGYIRSNKTVPDISVVYGLKARAYLTMEDWANAKKYAKMAQTGYSIMNEQEYTDHNMGFNSPNNSWMFCCTYKQDQPNIRDNDGDSSWSSFMCLELDPEKSGCGYASNYGYFMLIDRHLYNTMPYTDFRKKCFIDFKIDDRIKQINDNVDNDKYGKDDMYKKKIDSDRYNLISSYTSYPESVYNTGYNTSPNYKGVGGLSLKFRLQGGVAGRQNQHIGFAVSVPIMRVEEMYLIEAEAAGMIDLSEGKALLEKFAKTRDPQYVYGTHNDAYGNPNNTQFQNEIWWQRRVELWGEGFGTFDIKRLHKGIIRNYENTDHVDSYRWNLDKTPDWMTFRLPLTETNYNNKVTGDSEPNSPEGNSPIHVW